MTDLTPGIYQHYKGKKYEVIGVGHHTETLEELVLYRALYESEDFGKDALWARPKRMFLEMVIHEGKEVRRFSLIQNLNEDQNPGNIFNAERDNSGKGIPATDLLEQIISLSTIET